MGRGAGICIGSGQWGSVKNGKTVKNGENPPFFVLFVWIMYSFVLCGAFLVFVHGIGGGDRFSEIVRLVSLVVICGYNTRRAKNASFVAGGVNAAVFLCA